MLLIEVLVNYTRMKKIKIGYITTYDASDIHAWSGSGNFILNTLKNLNYDVVCIGRLKRSKYINLKCLIKKVFYRFMLSKTYLIDRNPDILNGYSMQLNNNLSLRDCDIVFSPGTVPISYFITNKPIIFWTDATFAGMSNFYPEFSNLCRETIRDGNVMEQSALSNCKLAIYSSDWAAETAINNYNVCSDKIKVVPFGANIFCNRDIKDIERIAENKNYDICKLLFIGVEWKRKGGDIALAVVDELNKRGVRAELHIVGCESPSGIPNYVTNHGFISKKTSEGILSLEKLFTDSHFLIVPSRAECAAVVFAEASSFGLPSLGTKVGGIPTVIHDGTNGQTFSLDAKSSEYCDFIETTMSSKDKYKKMAISSFNLYAENLNWKSSGYKISKLIDGLLTDERMKSV